MVRSSDGRTFPQVPMAFTSSPPFAGTGVPEGAPTVIPARPGLRAKDATGNESIAGIQSVIGADERKQITDTTVFPNSAIASLEMTFPSTNQFICTGFLGYGVKTNDAAVVGTRVRIFGYPADKPAGTMWGMPKRIKGVGPHKLFYKADTFGGQSGSPVYGKLSNVCRPCGFGIHAYAVGIEPFPESSSGTRIDSTVFASLAFWATQ